MIQTVAVGGGCECFRNEEHLEEQGDKEEQGPKKEKKNVGAENERECMQPVCWGADSVTVLTDAGLHQPHCDAGGAGALEHQGVRPAATAQPADH
jgi:hypothetical protein